MSEYRTSNDTLALAKLRASVTALDARVARGEKQRRWFFVGLIAVLLGFALSMTLSVWLILGRAQTRETYNHLFMQVICNLPPSDQTLTDLRHQVGCGVYQRPAPPSEGV